MLNAFIPALCLLVAPPVQGVSDATPQMVTIGAPGNAADTSSGLGAVALPFRMSTFEITNTEYVEFLNAVAQFDTNGLYSTLMTSSDRGGITRTGSEGNFVYAVKPDFDDKPVGSTSWYDAARFCNWLHNGQPSGEQTAATTETGAYDMSLAGGSIARLPGALYYIPTHDEWYKAAYYDPFDPGADALGTTDYWLYPACSDLIPIKATADAAGDVTNPGVNVANSDKGADWNGENGNVTTVGGTTSAGPWGTFDMGGNVNEITETPGTPITGPPVLPTRRLRGGDFSNAEVLMSSPAPFSGSLNMLAEGANVGFRIAALEPWYEFGVGLPGTTGTPTLSGTGLTVADEPVTVKLMNGLPGSVAVIFIGFSQINVPFNGGTLIPAADIILTRKVKPTGNINFSFTWPDGFPPQSVVFWQFWVFDPAGPMGLSATNGLQSTTP